METKTNDFKLGLFILIGACLFCGGLFAFGAMTYFKRTIVLETYLADNADGLAVGAPVTLRGVRIGKVTALDFSWNIYDHPEEKYVVVEFAVRSDISPNASGEVFAQRVASQIQNGLRARVKAQGFTGASLLALEYVSPAEYPAATVPWKPRHIYIPSAPSQVGELLASLQKTLHNASQVDFATLTGSIQHDLDHADRMMNRVEAGLSAADRLVGNLNAVNYRELSTNANALLTQVRAELKEMHLAKVSGDADHALLGLNGTIYDLDLVLANLDTGSFNDTLSNLRLASSELNDTLYNLHKYPSGFLLGSPPPPAKSVKQDRD